jgi:PAS domain S-box-containing protein
VRFAFQVRLVLVLLVLFLAALDLVNLFLLGAARRAMISTERERAAARAELAAVEIGREALLAQIANADAPSTAFAAQLRRWANRHALSRLSLLDARGGEVVGGGLVATPHGTAPRVFEKEVLDRLSAGRAVTSNIVPSRGGENATITALVPVLDASGKLLGALEAVHPAPEVGTFESRFRLVLAVQVLGVLLIAALALLFANWVSRPYRRLAAAVGEAGLNRSGTAVSADPDGLAEAFRAMVAKLREQEQALGSVGTRSGGLGDLVRFAGGPASTMATGVLVLDRQGRVAALNRSAAALLGVDVEAARQHDIIHVASAMRGLDALVRGGLDQGRAATREVLETTGPDGRPAHVGVSLSPSLSPYGEVEGALVLMTDLTEIRQLREQARIRENLAAVGQLSAGIAHEFRNALSTILGYARMIEKAGDPRSEASAREILKEVDSVREAVDEFLAYARPPEPIRSEVALGPLVRACAAAAPERIRVDVQGEFGAIVGDEGLLRRALGNILQNAADSAAESDRHLTVRIMGRKAGGGRNQQIDVEDDGPGIPEDRRKHVFVPFFTTRTKGTGLGLALVQRTIVDHGGTVEALEGPRGGALFRIRLPLIVVR